MKRLVKEHIIFENFAEDSDPIEDMGIGMKSVSSSQLWVVITEGSTDIQDVFFNKETAERVANKINKDIYDHSRKLHSNMSDEEYEQYEKSIRRMKYKVKTLSDAIYDMRDTIRNYDYDY
jgi:TRAP-type mannitol/chloroaromatic compound transport system substrate-binding protein